VRNRRLVPLLAAASIAVLGAAGCGSTSAAVQVGDETMSRGQFESSLDFVYENETWRTWLFNQPVPAESLRPEDAAPGAFSQQYVGAVASAHVQFLMAEQLVGDLDLTVSQDDRDAAEEQLAGEIDGGWDAVPEDLQGVYRDGWAAITVVQSDADRDTVQAAAQRIADEKVSVNSRYGSWDPDGFTVDPPTAPRPAPGGGTGSTGLPADGTDLPAG
jgi:hypothetical protein